MGRYEGLILGTNSDTVSFIRLIHVSNDSGVDQDQNTGDSEKQSGCILKVEATDFDCEFPMDTKNEESRLTTSFCLSSHSDGNSLRAGRVESLVVSAPNSGVGEMVEQMCPGGS